MKLLKLLISIDLTIIFPSFAHLWCHEPNAGHIAGLAGSRAVGQEAQRWACGGTQMAEMPRATGRVSNARGMGRSSENLGL